MLSEYNETEKKEMQRTVQASSRALRRSSSVVSPASKVHSEHRTRWDAPAPADFGFDCACALVVADCDFDCGCAVAGVDCDFDCGCVLVVADFGFEMESALGVSMIRHSARDPSSYFDLYFEDGHAPEICSYYEHEAHAICSCFEVWHALSICFGSRHDTAYCHYAWHPVTQIENHDALASLQVGARVVEEHEERRYGSRN